jgi:signal transduction histidine kinase
VQDNAEAGDSPSGARLLEVLMAVLTAVRQASGHREVLFHICEALARTIPCDRATVYVWSRRRKLYLPAADHGTPGEVATEFARRGYTADSFTEGGALRAGRTLHAVAGETVASMGELLALARLHALALVPLVFAGGNEGVVACGMHEPPAFAPGTIALLESLAPNIAVLIQNSRLQAEARRVAARRADLATWAAALLAASDVGQTVERVAEASCRLFHASHAAVLLAGEGALTSLSGNVRIPLEADSLVAEAVRTGRTIRVNDFARSRWAEWPLARVHQPAAVLAVPLLDAQGPLGVLTVVDVEDPYRFAPRDEEDAGLLAAIASVAVRKALLVEALTRASAAKSEFLANVSHDLRTPLNVIIGYAQLLAEGTFGPVSAEQTDTLARLLRTASAQVGLIDDLLDLARIEQGKLACELHPVALATLVPSLRETMDVLLRDRPVRFEVAVATDAVASTDGERLRQVLVNLLANAAKFTQEGCVRLVAAREGDAVRVAVEDTGPGMDAALRERALEPFVRGDHGPGGAGLGLAIVSRLLPLLRGRLVIESAPGRGTAVEVRLPAA